MRNASVTRVCQAVRVTSLVLQFPDIDPVAIHLGPLKIHWYAITYIVGFIVGYLLMVRRLKHEPYRSITKPAPYSREFIEDLLTYVIIGVLAGGRLGYCFFYKPLYYLQNPVEIFKIWDGGMSFHGGAIGVFLAFVWVAWRHKRPVLQIADLVVPAVPFGLMMGRIGNFINGELWGREAPEGLPWAMVFPTGGDVARHPSQIYQALMEGLLLFLLLWFYARGKRYRGQAAGFFVAGYGLFRFIGEYFREPDAHLGYLSLGLSMGQWLSLPMVLLGVIIWGWSTARKIDDSEEFVDDEENSVDNPVDDDVDSDDEAPVEVDEDSSEHGADKENAQSGADSDTERSPEGKSGS